MKFVIFTLILCGISFSSWANSMTCPENGIKEPTRITEQSTGTAIICSTRSTAHISLGKAIDAALFNAQSAMTKFCGTKHIPEIISETEILSQDFWVNTIQEFRCL